MLFFCNIWRLKPKYWFDSLGRLLRVKYIQSSRRHCLLIHLLKKVWEPCHHLGLLPSLPSVGFPNCCLSSYPPDRPRPSRICRAYISLGYTWKGGLKERKPERQQLCSLTLGLQLSFMLLLYQKAWQFRQVKYYNDS